MSRENETWFGFNITQKQSVWIFVIALISVILTSYTLFSFIYTYLIMIITSPFFDFGDFIMMMLTIGPPLGIIAVFLALSIYTVVKTRRIAKYYSQNLTMLDKK